MIKGLDVSRYNDDNNEYKTEAKGCDFMVIKAGEDRRATNTSFDEQLAWARSQGLAVGTYYWLRPRNIKEQAKWYAEKAKPRPDEWLSADFEAQNRDLEDRDPTYEEYAEFVEELRRLLPHAQIDYMNKDFWETRAKKRLAGDALWLAWYTTDDAKVKNYPGWTIWQYAEGPDYNWAKFESRAEMKAWCQSKHDERAKPGGAYRVTAKDGLNGRKDPSTKSESVALRKPGDVINVHAWVTGDGRLWGATATPTYYAADYLEKVKTTLYEVTERLNGRAGPGTNFDIVTDEPRPVGFPVEAERIVKGGGREWAVTPYGTHYALEYLKKVS